MELMTSLYTVQILNSISYSFISLLTQKGILSCSVQCQSNCIAFTYNKQTSECQLVTEFFTGTSLTTPTKFYMKNINCPVLDEYKYITSGSTKACVKFYTDNVVNWPVAKAVCDSEGSYLIQLETSQKTEMMVHFIQSRNSVGDSWIGFRDKYTTNTYMWNNNVILDHNDSRWAYMDGQPSYTSFGQYDDCGVLRGGKFWDYSCIDPKLDFICEKTM